MKLSEFSKEMVARYLKNYLYWQLETGENMRTKHFSITAVNNMASYLYDIALIVSKYEVSNYEWAEMYIKASEEARAEYLKDKPCTAND